MSGNKSSSSTPSVTTIRYIQTTLFEPNDVQVWVNPINCKGVMGAGLAAVFRDKFPDMHEDYQQRCKRGEVMLGKPYLYINSTPWILNFPTKNHWKDRSKLTDIERGLKYLVAHAKEWGIQSIAFPSLGCGLGKLPWNKVYPLMYNHLQQLEDVRVEIFSEENEPSIVKTESISKFFNPITSGKRKSPPQEKSPQITSKKNKGSEQALEESAATNAL